MKYNYKGTMPRILLAVTLTIIVVGSLPLALGIAIVLLLTGFEEDEQNEA